jgi:hypothetical protein
MHPNDENFNKFSVEAREQLSIYLDMNSEDDYEKGTEALWTVLQRGFDFINAPDYRDEIYLLVIKLSTDNPFPPSVYLGFLIISLCLDLFPPSKGFTTYLLHYLVNAEKKQYPEVYEVQTRLAIRYSISRLFQWQENMVYGCFFMPYDEVELRERNFVRMFSVAEIGHYLASPPAIATIYSSVGLLNSLNVFPFHCAEYVAQIAYSHIFESESDPNVFLYCKNYGLFVSSERQQDYAIAEVGPYEDVKDADYTCRNLIRTVRCLRDNESVTDVVLLVNTLDLVDCVCFMLYYVCRVRWKD